jgi:hypothetical protein
MDLFAVMTAIRTWHVLPTTVLYIGPDVFLPLTSALAAIMGVLLMFWHRVVAGVRKVWRIVARKNTP